MLKQKRAEFSSLFKEFVDAYLPTPDGRDHIKRYAEERKEGRQNFQAITEAADSGEKVADEILLKLLPYRDFPAYKDKGAWIHIAYAPGDHAALLKYKRPKDWPQVALTLLNFISAARRLGAPGTLRRHGGRRYDAVHRGRDAAHLPDLLRRDARGRRGGRDDRGVDPRSHLVSARDSGLRALFPT